ncbi:MAG: hypothetical protein BAJALOKI3v1_150037 [Promethearchaeota archaeon]|jgi:predicted transcriptional regulator|nr:MAG: hypothetical protein BAJALOKI3v1_150037 [Candidatus Lokiarchaeota archaeon]
MKEIDEKVKEQILELISIPGMDIEDIAVKVNLDYETVHEVLSEEYLKNNLDFGRRLCCRWTL